jgi:hypothetical protein
MFAINAGPARGQCLVWPIWAWPMNLRELWTANDNTTLELAYVLWSLSIVAGICFQGYAMAYGKSFDFLAYGGGAGALLALGGLSKKFGA